MLIVDRLDPDDIGRSADPSARARLPDALEESASALTAGRQSIRDDALMQATVEHDVLLALRVRPGQYVLPDTTVVLIHPAERATGKLEKRIRGALAVTDPRSPYQGVHFAVQQLTEMAVRASAPGTNDPCPDTGADVVALLTTVLDTVRWYATSAPLVMHHCLELVPPSRCSGCCLAPRPVAAGTGSRPSVRGTHGVRRTRMWFDSWGNLTKASWPSPSSSRFQGHAALDTVGAVVLEADGSLGNLGAPRPSLP